LGAGRRGKRQDFLTVWASAFGRGKKTKYSPENGGFGRQRLSDARAVLCYSRELALAVRDGPTTLDEALKKVEAERS
jgi:hypothetical protein